MPNQSRSGGDTSVHSLLSLSMRTMCFQHSGLRLDLSSGKFSFLVSDVQLQLGQTGGPTAVLEVSSVCLLPHSALLAACFKLFFT